MDGPVTIRAVHRDLSTSRELAYTTVAPSIHRLVGKGVVERHDSAVAHEFSPKVSRGAFFEELLAEALDVLDSPTAAMAGFVGQLDRRSRLALTEALERVSEQE